MRNLQFRHWVLIAVILGAMWLLGSCATTRPVPPLVAAPTPEQLEQQAQLPPYLVPPPPAATPKQVQRWTDAQTQALANVNAPARKVKLKNVGNTDSDVSVAQGITGRQLATVAVLLGAIGLVCWLKPWRK